MQPEPAHEGVYRTEQPNEETILHEGLLSLALGPFDVDDEQVITGEGEVALSWLPSPRLRFTLRYDCAVEDDEPPYVAHRLFIPGSVRPAPCQLLGISTRFSGPMSGRRELVGRLTTGAFIGGEGPTEVLEFHIVNFPEYSGHPIDAENAGWTGRLRMASDNWVVDIDAVQYRHALYGALRASGGYAITNVGRLERTDGKPFSPATGFDVVDALRHLLSFIAGGWVGVAMFVGRDADGAERWQFWQSLGATPSELSWTWLPTQAIEEDRIHVPDFGHSLGVLLNFWSDPEWQGILRRSVRWQVESASAPRDTGLVLAQAGLELISWAQLVMSGHWSRTKYKNTDAAERIRCLLDLSQIPREIPGRFYRLREVFAKSNVDGPAAIAKGRNAVVHPRQGGVFASPECRDDAHRLALQYLELTVLRMLEFDGIHADRSAWRTTERVPWYSATAPNGRQSEPRS